MQSPAAWPRVGSRLGGVIIKLSPTVGPLSGRAACFVVWPRSRRCQCGFVAFGSVALSVLPLSTAARSWLLRMRGMRACVRVGFPNKQTAATCWAARIVRVNSLPLPAQEARKIASYYMCMYGVRLGDCGSMTPFAGVLWRMSCK